MCEKKPSLTFNCSQAFLKKKIYFPHELKVKETEFILPYSSFQLYK